MSARYFITCPTCGGAKCWEEINARAAVITHYCPDCGYSRRIRRW